MASAWNRGSFRGDAGSQAEIIFNGGRMFRCKLGEGGLWLQGPESLMFGA